MGRTEICKEGRKIGEKQGGERQLREGMKERINE